MARRPVGGRRRSAATTPTSPTTCPPMVDDLALEVTARRRRPASRRRVALQDWFREDGGFAYDLERRRRATAPTTWSGSSPRARAAGPATASSSPSAMAVMARIARHPRPGRGRLPDAGPDRRRDLGVQRPRPARLAGALLPRLRLGPVRADPRAAGPAVPGYTTERVASDRRADQPGQRPRRADLLPEPRPDRQPSAAGRGLDDADADEDRRRVPVAAGRAVAPPACCWWSGCSLLPRDRAPAADAARRLGAGPEAAWAELRDTAIDLRRPVAARTGRRARPATALVDHLGAPVRPTTPRSARGTAPTSRPRRSTRWTGSCSPLERLRYARGRPRAGRRRALRDELETVRRRAARRRHPACPPPGRPGGPRSVLTPAAPSARRPSAAEPITVRPRRRRRPRGIAARTGGNALTRQKASDGSTCSGRCAVDSEALLAAAAPALLHPLHEGAGGTARAAGPAAGRRG